LQSRRGGIAFLPGPLLVGGAHHARVELEEALAAPRILLPHLVAEQGPGGG